MRSASSACKYDTKDLCIIFFKYCMIMNSDTKNLHPSSNHILSYTFK